MKGERGQYHKAEELYTEVKDFYARHDGLESSNYSNIIVTMASLYQTTGEWEEAEALFLEANAIYAKTLGRKNAICY